MNSKILIFALLLLILLGCTPEQKQVIQENVKITEEKIKENIEDLKDSASVQSCKVYLSASEYIENYEFEVNLTNASIDIAVSLSSKIGNLSEIDVGTFEDYDRYKSFESDLNYIIGMLNENLGTSFKTLNVEESEFKEISTAIRKYSPLIEPYNHLIKSARQVNREDQKSIAKFYISAFALGTDAFLVQGSYIHKATFENLGKLNRALGLYKIRDICGNKCFGFTLSKIYWWAREKIENFSISFGAWLGENFREFKEYGALVLTNIGSKCQNLV